MRDSIKMEFIIVKAYFQRSPNLNYGNKRESTIWILVNMSLLNSNKSWKRLSRQRRESLKITIPRCFTVSKSWIARLSSEWSGESQRGGLTKEPDRKLKCLKKFQRKTFWNWLVRILSELTRIFLFSLSDDFEKPPLLKRFKIVLNSHIKIISFNHIYLRI